MISSIFRKTYPAALVSFGFVTASQAATIMQQDVTSSLLGSTTFVDDAATGGADVTNHDNAPGSYNRFWDLDGDGSISAPGVAGTITITDWGFASSASSIANDATTVTVTFTYLGADEVLGGGDDVIIGSESVGYTHIGAGEYYVAFDNPISATIDGQGSRFRITVSPDDNDGALQESIRFKSGPQDFEGGNGVKFSVSGSFVAIPEPTSALLLGLGLFGLARRRR